MSISVSNPSALDLRERQSVRAKFRLSGASIDAISILSAQLGIKQTAISAYKNSFDDIANFIEKGKIIEEFRPE